MQKILSIIIPTYNMEALLPRCLESLMNCSRREQVEAIVVNDGSKDGSLRVAQEWQTRYPENITVIDKPNGNYGSTINAALPVAKGKYVRILDSDDWYDSAALDTFLKKMEETDCDMAVCHFTQIEPGGNYQVIKYNTMGREPYEYGRVYSMDNVLGDGYIRFFLMHAIAYRTQMLRDMGYRQTEGISYTDTEWACYPIYRVQTIVFLDINLYQYNMDRAGQTMDPAVLMKSLPQLERVFGQLVAYYGNYDRLQLSDIRKAFLKKYLGERLRLIYKIYLLDMPSKDFDAEKVEKLEAFDRQCAKYVRQYGLAIRLYPENKLLRIDYVKYWHHHHKRWPKWLECFNHGLDVVVKWLYVRLFRR